MISQFPGYALRIVRRIVRQKQENYLAMNQEHT
jgi:hypothetical protein